MESKTRETEPGEATAAPVDYRSEQARWASFTKWPLSRPDPKSLAAAGFYSTGRGDEVRCFKCNVGLWEWSKDHEPLVCHGAARPACPFFLKLPCGNIPMNENREEPTASTSKDSTEPETPPRKEGEVDLQKSKWIRVPMRPHPVGFSGRGNEPGPLYPAYGMYMARLGSFASWPKHMQPSKEILAEAGFYYTGWSDQVGCFSCGGQLKHWEPADDPWVKHARLFPQCVYIKTVKGPYMILTNPPATARNLPVPGTSRQTPESTCANPPGNNALAIPPPANNGIPEIANRPPADIGILLKNLVRDNRGPAVRICGEIIVSRHDWKECQYCSRGAVEYVNLPCFHANMCPDCSYGTNQCKECGTPLRTLVKVTYRART